MQAIGAEKQPCLAQAVGELLPGGKLRVPFLTLLRIWLIGVEQQHVPGHGASYQ